LRSIFKTVLLQNIQGLESEKPLDTMVSVLIDDHWKFVRNSLSPSFSGGKLRRVWVHVWAFVLMYTYIRYLIGSMTYQIYLNTMTTLGVTILWYAY